MLNYQIQDRQSDKWLVFVHGIGGSTKTWKRQINEFKDYNLLLLDLPGHGESQLQNFIAQHFSQKNKKCNFVSLNFCKFVIHSVDVTATHNVVIVDFIRQS